MFSILLHVSLVAYKHYDYRVSSHSDELYTHQFGACDIFWNVTLA